MAGLKRTYKFQNLTGQSNTEYNFSGYSTKNYSFSQEMPKMAGIFYIGKIDDDDRVIDHFDLQFHDDIYKTFFLYKNFLLEKDTKDLYHFFVLEENGDKEQKYLDDAIIDLNKANYTKKLSL